MSTIKKPHVFGPLELEPLEKKSGAGAAPKKTQGAGAANNMFLYRLLEDKKHKEIVHFVTLLQVKQKVFMTKNNFTCFIIFSVLYIVACGEKNILPNLTNSQEPEPHVLAPWSLSRQNKKYQEPEPLGKKINSRSRPLGKKKPGAGAAKIISSSQPCF